jgi:hypothetical protein
VFDPPYVHGSKTIHPSLGNKYGINKPITAKEITENYRRIAEFDLFRFDSLARSLLNSGGILILKTQDDIESGKQVWQHFLIWQNYLKHGWQLLDLSVVMQKGKPLIRYKQQKHVRKNHSYFMVFRHERSRHRKLAERVIRQRIEELKRRKPRARN